MLLSTGGTARHLVQAGIPVEEVSDYTGFPEMMAGRVKTLHPKIHGGLLGRRGVDDAAMDKHGIAPIDLLAVNLYPFEAVIGKSDCAFEDAIENIDIGGPAMVRAAAKNYASVTVVVDPADYSKVLADMREQGGAVTEALRYELAVKAFACTARYDAAISNYLGKQAPDGGSRRFPPFYTLQYLKRTDMRYGENPHQAAALYADVNCNVPTLIDAKQLQGKALSFNNMADADAAFACVQSFNDPACVIVKHANPCGAAIGANLLEAYARAYACDPTSAFGGIIAVNRALDRDTARAIIERQFVEVILAPSIEQGALDVVSQKRNVRVLAWGEQHVSKDGADADTLDYKRIAGGLLFQQKDRTAIDRNKLKSVTRRAPNAAEMQDLLFAWRVAKHVKSNAIVYARDGRTLGIGAGQMSRIDSARIAAMKAADANLDIRGAVLASDAFFPFRDSIDLAAEAGIAAIIQPGGSRRDEEVIAAADEHKMAMVFTGVRHFRH
jgi:phosphoribosylaminoimidazolecarboxamide formyltransferase/IMP cyclohydrolase